MKMPLVTFFLNITDIRVRKIKKPSYDNKAIESNTFATLDRTRNTLEEIMRFRSTHVRV